MEKQARALTEEHLQPDDLKAARDCAVTLNNSSMLPVFVWTVIQSTFAHMYYCAFSAGEDSPTAALLHQLGRNCQCGRKPGCRCSQYLENLAQVISPVLIESGFPMEELFWEISKPLLPFGKPGVLVAASIRIRVKRLTAEMVGAMWTGSGSHGITSCRKIKMLGTLSRTTRCNLCFQKQGRHRK